MVKIIGHLTQAKDDAILEALVHDPRKPAVHISYSSTTKSKYKDHAL